MLIYNAVRRNVHEKDTHTHTVGESLKTRPCVNVVHIFNVLFTLY